MTRLISFAGSAARLEELTRDFGGDIVDRT
jgi:hypothetical protein